jgi:hypothetical protein
MNPMRRKVLWTTVSAAVLAGCGGGDDPVETAAATPPPPPATGACTSASITIGTNHGHVMVIPATDLDSTTEKTYPIQGDSSHPHNVILTAAQLAQLKDRATVEVQSSTDNGHAHTITLTCAA